MHVLAVIFIHTVMAEDNQYFFQLTHNPDYLLDSDKLLESFYQPIKFSKVGFSTFLKEEFNRKEYVTEFIPHNLDIHVEQFLRWCNQSQQGIMHANASLRLFTNKVKAAPYMTITPVIGIAQRLPDLVKPYFIDVPVSLFAKLKKLIKKILFTAFNAHFDYFKSEPNKFLDTLANDIVEEIKSSELVQDHIDKEQLRGTLVRFLDTSIGKLVWSPFDQIDIWESFKQLSNDLVSLRNHEIISEDDLDDLLTTLTQRFVYFLELTGSDLSPDTLIIIETELASDNLAINLLPEQEEYITTKREHILNAIKMTQAKILARSQGIITEVISY